MGALVAIRSTSIPNGSRNPRGPCTSCRGNTGGQNCTPKHRRRLTQHRRCRCGQPKPGQYGCGIFGLGRGPAHPFGRPAFLRPASFAYDALWKKQTSGRPQTATLAEKCTSRCGRDQERSFVNRMAHVGSCACKRCLLGRLTTEARGVYASGGDGGRTSASAPSCRCQCISTCCDPLAATSWQMTGLIPERSRIGSATRRSRTPHATPN